MLVKHHFSIFGHYNQQKICLLSTFYDNGSYMKAFWYNEKRKNVSGIRIRELRKEKHMTQTKLAIKAQLAGYDYITESSIIKSELGTRFIPDYEVAIFAELLDTTTEYLLQRENV